MAVVGVSAAAILAAVGVFAAAAAAGGITTTEGAVAVANAEQTLVRIGVMSEHTETFIRIASSEGEPVQLIQEIVRAANSL